jgi:hypothetical protein
VYGSSGVCKKLSVAVASFSAFAICSDSAKHSINFFSSSALQLPNFRPTPKFILRNPVVSVLVKLIQSVSTGFGLLSDLSVRNVSKCSMRICKFCSFMDVMVEHNTN